MPLRITLCETCHGRISANDWSFLPSIPSVLLVSCNHVTVSRTCFSQLATAGGGGSPPSKIGPNHLEERLLDQAQAQTRAAPPFWGSFARRSIPEGMILDVYPLVKSFFCLTKRPPNEFFDFEAYIPLKLNVTFVLGGGGGGLGGGSKVCA